MRHAKQQMHLPKGDVYIHMGTTPTWPSRHPKRDRLLAARDRLIAHTNKLRVEAKVARSLDEDDDDDYVGLLWCRIMQCENKASEIDGKAESLRTWYDDPRRR